MNRIPIRLAAGALAATLVGSMAVSQPIPEIVVLGTRTVKTHLEKDALTPTPLYKTLSLSYSLSIADLDLKTSDGAAALEKRVNDAAIAVCAEIGRQYPESGPDDATCAKLAAKKAMVKARALIAAAQSKPAQ